MARPAPSDLNYAPSQAFQFSGNTNVDLTAQFPEFPTASSYMIVTSVTAGNLIVRMQADPATDVNILFPAATMMDLRGAFVALRAGGPADMKITAFWQGGPA